MRTETHDDPSAMAPPSSARAHPALVAVFSIDRPQCLTFPLSRGALELGRDDLAAAGLPDSRASRRHVRVEVDGDRWAVRDLGSRNGTFVDGRPAQSARNRVAPIVRIGRTVLLAVVDGRPFLTQGIQAEGGTVIGPSLREAHERIAVCARGGTNLMISGESGAGKERAAEAFHAAGRGHGPFVAVNCATIPKELAEGVLFGARRGAYTGAVAETMGLVQSASGGTLFLDEIAELDPGVQAKLLRVLETKRVTPLGAVSSVPVDFHLCAATHKDLRAEVAAGRFRQDLYFRIGRPIVRLPPVRERREEIPWLLERALAAAAESGATHVRVTASPELVEAFMLRPWPGNVRELLAEARVAALTAMSAGRTCLGVADLDDDAGQAIGPSEASPRPGGDTLEPAPRADMPSDVPPAGRRKPADIRRAELDEALRASRWDLARAAALLGISRTSLYSLIEESPHLRTASDLKPDEIAAAHRECRGDVARMVERLQVSERALRRRLRDLGLDERGS